MLYSDFTVQSKVAFTVLSKDMFTPSSALTLCPAYSIPDASLTSRGVLMLSVHLFLTTVGPYHTLFNIFSLGKFLLSIINGSIFDRDLNKSLQRACNCTRY